jgi:transposase
VPQGFALDQIDIWFQDEARVGQRGTLTRTWAKKGTRPRLRRQQQFEYAYLFGAVCPAKDKGVGLVMPAVNKEAMQMHLTQIAAEIPEGRHGVVILDRAAWHTTRKLKTFNKLTLMYLPPASPELNPTEQVWRQLREDSLANRSFENYDDIVESSCKAWNYFTEKKEAIRQLCSRGWANL